jgi:hypothetical protein
LDTENHGNYKCATDFWAYQVKQYKDFLKEMKKKKKTAPLPEEKTYGSVIFSYPKAAGKKSFKDAILIKVYNGADGNFIYWKYKGV